MQIATKYNFTKYCFYFLIINGIVNMIGPQMHELKPDDAYMC